MAAYLETAGEVSGSMNVTPSGAESGRRAIRIGSRIPCFASRAAAFSTRGSEPSGNTIFFFERRARSTSPARNTVADSGTGIGSFYLNPLDASREQKQNGHPQRRQQSRHREHRNVGEAIDYKPGGKVQDHARCAVPYPGQAGDAAYGVVREQIGEDGEHGSRHPHEAEHRRADEDEG